MLPIGIDRPDQLLQGHVALAGDLLQAVPELIFKTDARLVACNDNRALRNRRLHGFSPSEWICSITPEICSFEPDPLA